MALQMINGRQQGSNSQEAYPRETSPQLPRPPAGDRLVDPDLRLEADALVRVDHLAPIAGACCAGQIALPEGIDAVERDLPSDLGVPHQGRHLDAQLRPVVVDDHHVLHPAPSCAQPATTGCSLDPMRKRSLFANMRPW